MKIKNILTVFLLGMTFLGSAQLPYVTTPYKGWDRPRWGIYPNEDNTYRTLSFGLVSTPDTLPNPDTIKIFPGNYETWVVPIGAAGFDSLKDSIVYTVKSTYNSFIGDNIVFLVQCNNAAVKTKVKFRNNYTKWAYFTTAADSTVSLTSKQKLYMTFRCFAPGKYLELSKIVNFLARPEDEYLDPEDPSSKRRALAGDVDYF